MRWAAIAALTGVFVVQAHRGAGHSARALGDRQQGVNAVQGASGNGHADDRKGAAHHHHAWKGGGQPGYSQNDGLFPAGFQLTQELDQLREVAVGGQDGFFIRNILLRKILAGGFHKGLIIRAAVDDDDFHGCVCGCETCRLWPQAPCPGKT